MHCYFTALHPPARSLQCTRILSWRFSKETSIMIIAESIMTYTAFQETKINQHQQINQNNGCTDIMSKLSVGSKIEIISDNSDANLYQLIIDK